ncbi:MAG: hypothetical protein ACK559_00180 [bacterium]
MRQSDAVAAAGINHTAAYAAFGPLSRCARACPGAITQAVHRHCGQ